MPRARKAALFRRVGAGQKNAAVETDRLSAVCTRSSGFDLEIALFQAWAKAGAPEGNKAMTRRLRRPCYRCPIHRLRLIGGGIYPGCNQERRLPLPAHRSEADPRSTLVAYEFAPRPAARSPPCAHLFGPDGGRQSQRRCDTRTWLAMQRQLGREIGAACRDLGSRRNLQRVPSRHRHSHPAGHALIAQMHATCAMDQPRSQPAQAALCRSPGAKPSFDRPDSGTPASPSIRTSRRHCGRDIARCRLH